MFHSFKAPKAAHCKKTRGFTLLELLITVAIVGILSAVAYPSYLQYVLRSHRTDAKTALLDLATREERYFSVNNTYSSTASDLGYPSAYPLAVQSSGTSYYNLTVTASSATGFTATATPTGGQTSDTSCYTYQVDQLGTQSNYGATGTLLTSSGCW